MIGLGLSITQRAVLQMLRAEYSPAGLFAASEPGVWYEPSLTNGTCFQDAAGTTPVTAVEQPVGLMLDKSKGLVLGPELVTNGGPFTNTTGWTAQSSSISAEGGLLKVVTTGSGQGASFALTGLDTNKRYKISVDVVGGSANYAVGFGAGWGSFNSGGTGQLSGTRTVTLHLTGMVSGWILQLFVYGAATTYFNNISVRELPGNHATQTTATSRPVLSARYNLLTKTEQFDDAYWTKTAVTVTPNATPAPDGTATAELVVENTASGNHRTERGSLSITAGSSVTASIRFKEYTAGRNISLGLVGGGSFVTTVFSSSGAGVLSQSDVVGSVFSSKVNSVSGPDAMGFYTASITVQTATITSLVFLFDIANGTATNYTGDGTSGIYIWGASLVHANQASLPYQRVNTATDYDADPSKFKPYLRFDGVDDWLVTPTITPGTDKAQVFAGVRKLSDGSAVIVEHSVNVNLNAGTIGLFNGFPTSTAYQFYSRGTLGGDGSNTATAPITNVLTGTGDISGDSAILRVNGTQVSINTANQGTGNFLAYPLYIGRRGGTTLPFNGQIYSLIVRFGSNLPAATIASTESWVAGKTGITL